MILRDLDGNGDIRNTGIRRWETQEGGGFKVCVMSRG